VVRDEWGVVEGARDVDLPMVESPVITVHESANVMFKLVPVITYVHVIVKYGV